MAVRFSGWAFRVEGVTEHYLFNVFLINKILAMILIPFIIILAFADAEVAKQMIVVSFLVGGLLLLNRYIRSWQVFGSFFQYSKFHFFMYLCASELLPLAVLMKLLVKGLMFY
jgi:Na+-translocating ferredoxin:NAD+ oxidoreductase RnfD subunit